MEERGKNSGRILKLPLSGTGISVLLVLIAITVAFLSVAPVMAQQAEVSVNAPEYVEEKETFAVTIAVEGITDLNSGMFDLTFDHKVVKVDDVTDGSIDDTEIPVTMWADMDSDTIRVMLELPETTTASGSGYLAEITFKVKGDAGEESALEIAEGELVKYVFEDERATPEAIEVNWNGAVVKIGVEEEKDEEEEEEEEPTPEANVTEEPTSEANVTESPTPEANVTEEPTSEANVTESPTPSLAPEETPRPTATPVKKSTPKPTATPVKKSTPTPTPTPVPGFEAIFAIAMMSAIAYILVRKEIR